MLKFPTSCFAGCSYSKRDAHTSIPEGQNLQNIAQFLLCTENIIHKTFVITSRQHLNYIGILFSLSTSRTLGFFLFGYWCLHRHLYDLPGLFFQKLMS